MLWLAGLGAAAQFAKIGLVLPELGLLYPHAGSLLGFLVSFVSLIGALFGLCAGAIAAQLSLQRLLMAGLLLGALVSLVQSLQVPLWLMLITRVLEGCSHLAIVITAPTLISTTSPRRWRSAAMTLWSTFFGVSYALTAWLGLPLVQSHGVSALFLAHGLFLILVAISLAFIMTEALPGVGEVEAGIGTDTDTEADVDVDVDANSDIETSVDLTFSQILAEHRRAWTSPRISAPAAGWLFYTLTFVALLAVIPGIVEPDQRSFVSSALPIASILASVSLGVVLLSFVSAVHVVCIGFLIAILVSVAYIAQPGEPLLAIALFASLGLVQGATFASLPQLNPNRGDQVLANGALAQAGNLGNLCGTPLLLFVLAVGGFNVMIVFVVLCYALAVFAHLFLAGKRRTAQIH